MQPDYEKYINNFNSLYVYRVLFSESGRNFQKFSDRKKIFGKRDCQRRLGAESGQSF